MPGTDGSPVLKGIQVETDLDPVPHLFPNKPRFKGFQIEGIEQIITLPTKQKWVEGGVKQKWVAAGIKTAHPGYVN